LEFFISPPPSPSSVECARASSRPRSRTSRSAFRFSPSQSSFSHGFGFPPLRVLQQPPSISFSPPPPSSRSRLGEGFPPFTFFLPDSRPCFGSEKTPGLEGLTGFLTGLCWGSFLVLLSWRNVCPSRPAAPSGFSLLFFACPSSRRDRGSPRHPHPSQLNILASHGRFP